MNEREDGGRRSIKRRVGLVIAAVCVALLTFALYSRLVCGISALCRPVS